MSLRGKRILVTGGAGFIGSHLVDELIPYAPDTVIVVDNFFLGKMENLEKAKKAFEGLKVYREDVSDYTATENIIRNEKIDVVFDLAVKPLPYSFTNPEGAYMTSVRIAYTLCSLLKKGLFETMIHFSSSEAYGSAVHVPMDENHPLNPTTPYSAGKASADLLIMSYYRTFNVDATVIRPFNTYGPRQNDQTYAAVVPVTIKRILSGLPPCVEWDGRQTRDFIFVNDLVHAALQSYFRKETRGRIVNIAGGKEIQIGWLVETLARLMNYEGEIERKPKRSADIARHYADISLAKELLGFEPVTDMEQGLKETIQWYTKYYMTVKRHEDGYKEQ
jgi:UDP-glucose 4-epimerase